MISTIFAKLLSAEIGVVADNKLTTEQLAIADKKINQTFTQPDADPVAKLEGGLLKAFIRLPFDNGDTTQALTNFAEGNYNISNDKVEQNGKMATSDTNLGFGELASDGWSISRVITATLSDHTLPFQEIANTAGKQIGMLIFACEKYSNTDAHPFTVLEHEFGKAEIAPFEDIHLLEFGGNPQSTIANPKHGISKILGQYKLHTGAGWHADANSAQFVTLANADSFFTRTNGFNHIIARNVFNKGGVDEKTEPVRNATNLFCVFSNILPHDGKLYISTTIFDTVECANKAGLLRLTGFATHGWTSHCRPDTSYILRRDFNIRDHMQITPTEFDLYQHQTNSWVGNTNSRITTSHMLV